MNPQTPDNEVARLKGLLSRAIRIADEFWQNQKQSVTIWHYELADELEEIKSEARLSPSPKEPASLGNEVARLRKLMREYIDFVDENLGTTADWPMEAAFDDETTAQRHCDLLNAMKREVKPEDIN